MASRIFHVAAFTGPGADGNPAAVCLLERPADAGWMQRVAREMNLSETAFVSPGEGDGGMGLRWFTPAAEVDLCGHATLATAFTLWSEVGHDGDPLRFATRSGILEARRAGDSIALTFPARPPVEVSPPAGLLDGLGIGAAAYVGEAPGDNLLVALEDEAALRALTPDPASLAALDAHGVIVTAPAVATDADFVSRYFAPKVGIDEDPVTGSAHCTLGPYWATRLGRSTLGAFQASPRGGRLTVTVDGERVVLEGAARLTLRGEIVI